MHWKMSSYHWTPREVLRSILRGKESTTQSPRSSITILCIPQTLLLLWTPGIPNCPYLHLCVEGFQNWEGWTTHSHGKTNLRELTPVLVWEIPWTEKPGRLPSMGLQESDTAERLIHHHRLGSCGGQVGRAGVKVAQLPCSWVDNLRCVSWSFQRD